ncbi:DNA-packaging protein [Photobacterium sp. TLY01]|uniref:DNA-packaging protein n=1 Tax=Photobacterium sp. TLY01 TaxID=2907534 RepID=UPI001F45BF44|nr:DNA-packaging protein [Photobacterium sp. TLY01]UIP27778.1 DNA-packaging protein [Photobacterium sp. TLY01]
MPAPKKNKYNNKYQSEFAPQCRKLCMLGATDMELARFFNVSRETIKNWVKMQPEFAEGRKSGKMIADAKVASKLFHRATGCTIKKQKVLNNGDIIEYMEELPPDVRAIKHWLQFRQRNNWSPDQKVKLFNDAKNPLAFALDNVEHEAETRSCLPSGCE